MALIPILRLDDDAGGATACPASELAVVRKGPRKTEA